MGQTSRYGSTSEARDEQLFLKGWLPDILPESATGIVVTTYVDIGWCEGEFNLPASDMTKFLGRLTASPRPFKYDAWKDDIARFAKEKRRVCTATP